MTTEVKKAKTMRYKLKLVTVIIFLCLTLSGFFWFIFSLIPHEDCVIEGMSMREKFDEKCELGYYGDMNISDCKKVWYSESIQNMIDTYYNMGVCE